MWRRMAGGGTLYVAVRLGTSRRHQKHRPCGSRDVHHCHMARNCGSVGAELMLLLEYSFIRPHSITPAHAYVLTSSSIRTPHCGRSLRANDRVRPLAPK